VADTENSADVSLSTAELKKQQDIDIAMLL
jgi:hypothetical protein